MTQPTVRPRPADVAGVGPLSPSGDGSASRNRDSSPEPDPLTLARRAATEALGTGLLVAAVVGSGIMGERLAGGSIGLALLANTAATGRRLSR
jgi:hypothetical protein